MPNGSDCWRPPEPDGYADICTEHMHEVAMAWAGQQPTRYSRCKACSGLNVAIDRLSRLQKCMMCGDVVEFEPIDVDSRNLGASEPHSPEQQLRPSTRTADVVYYLKFGDRVKIGTTGNLPERIKAIPHDEILAVEPGDLTRERGRHRMFAELRIDPHKEWFNIDDRLLAHTRYLRKQFGAPMELWRKLANKAAT